MEPACLTRHAWPEIWLFVTAATWQTSRPGKGFVNKRPPLTEPVPQSRQLGRIMEESDGSGHASFEVGMSDSSERVAAELKYVEILPDYDGKESV